LEGMGIVGSVPEWLRSRRKGRAILVPPAKRRV
jgi:hypothetical protein